MKSDGIQSRWPNLFLIGAPKCGTTAMSHYLGGHPQIYMSEEVGVKEPEYFNFDLSTPGTIHEQSNYLALFERADPNIYYWGEASPLYLYSEVAVPNILNKSPDARFIVMVRNPLDIVQSLFHNRIKAHEENVENLMEAWNVQQRRITGEYPLPAGLNDVKLFQYGLIAKVGSQIERAQSFIDRKNMHIVVYDDFARNPKLEYQKLLEFLGLECDSRTDFPVLNRRVEYRSPSLQFFLRQLAFFRRRLHIPGGWGINALIDRFNVIEGKGIYCLPPDLRTELINYFRDDVSLLSNLLQRNLAHWLE